MSLHKKSIAFTLLFILLVACAPPVNRTSAQEIIVSPTTLKPTRQSGFAPFLLASWTMGEIRDIAWSPNSSMFAVNYLTEGEDKHFVQAFNIKALNSMWIAKDSLAWDLIFTPDGQNIVESNTNVPFFYWRSIDKGKVVHLGEFTNLSQISPGDCHGGGQILVANARESIILIADYGNLLGPRTNNTIAIRKLDLKTRKCKNLFAYQGSFDLFDLNSSGTFLAYGGVGQDNSVAIWDVEKQIDICQTSKADAGRFIPNENTLAVLRDQKMIFIDASTCQEVRELNISPDPKYTNYLAFSPDGKYFAIARDSVQIMDVSTGEILAQIPFPENAVPIDGKLFLSGITFSPDGHCLLVAYYLLDSADHGEVQLWQLK